MGLGAPSTPDAGQLAGAQSNLNDQAAIEQQRLNTKNFSGPIGSSTYTNSGLTQGFTGAANDIFNAYQTAQKGAGSAASSLGGLFGDFYGKMPDFNAMTSPQVQAQMKAYQDYQQPFWNMKENNLAGDLHNKGIEQGSTAGNNAWRGLYGAENQGLQGALMNFMPQAQDMALKAYGAPLQTLAGLLGISQPGAPMSGVNLPYTTQYTPQVQNPAANYMGAAEQQFAQQQKQYENFVGGLGTIGSGIAGLFGGPAAMGGAIGGLFGLGGSGAGGGGVA